MTKIMKRKTIIIIIIIKTVIVIKKRLQIIKWVKKKLVSLKKVVQ
jgi:hypothetical protein